MQKTLKNFPKKSLDFFSLHRWYQLRKYFFSGSIAVVMAFSIVSVSHGDVDMQGLMASVANVSVAPRLDADLILKREGSNISLVFGANAKNVDTIDFTILSDPTRFHSLTSTNTAVHITGDAEIGAYHVSIDMSGSDIVSGTRIVDFVANIDPGTPITLIDSQFVSDGMSYNITSKGE